jgi:GGDEF domain-containing protein
MRSTLNGLLPGGAVLLVALVVALGSGRLASVASTGLPWIAFGGAAYLAAARGRSRVMALVAGLALLHLLASTDWGGASALHLGGGFFALSVVLLAPLEDQGVISVKGLVQVGLVVSLGASAGVVVHRAPDLLETILSFELFPSSLSGWGGIPHPVAGAFVLAVPLALGVIWFRGGAVECGAWWSLVTVGLALLLGGEPPATSILLMSGGLTLGLSAVDPSARWVDRDELTGLPGRPILLRDLQSMGGTFATSVVDILDFPHLQDRYGHDVGGQILKMAASRLARLPGGGRAYRYGGDEFALLFPGRTKEDALQYLLSFQRSLEESPFVLRRWPRPGGSVVDKTSRDLEAEPPTERVSVRVSIGVADSTEARLHPESVLARADEEAHRFTGPS